MSLAGFQKGAQLWQLLLAAIIPILGIVWLGATKWAEVDDLQNDFARLNYQVESLTRGNESVREELSSIKSELARMNETLLWLKENR